MPNTPEVRTSIAEDEFLAVRREFVLKVDGKRPVLYPLDYINTRIFFLGPAEGFILSLLDGQRPFAEIRRIFQAVVPAADDLLLSRVLLDLDQRVRRSPTPTGIGAQGLVEFSPTPLAEACRYDPRDFVLSPDDYKAVMGDIKTRFRLEVPVHIFTIFTHRCFTDCVYCYAERRRVPEMPLSRWRQIFREMADLGILMASPDNGDTFARKGGIEFLECLLEHGMHFLVSTKAHVSKDRVKRLVDAGFTRKVRGVLTRPVQLSIDAVDEDLAKRILNTPQARTEKTLETFENFLAFGIMAKIKAVITGLNYGQPKAIVDYFYPRGARRFHFVRYHRSFHRHTDDLFVRKEHAAVLKRQFDEIRDRHPDIEIVEDLTAARENGQPPSPEQARQRWENRIGCGGGWSALGIAADGAAFLCEQMKIDEETIVGDARTQSIMEIWNGQPMLRFIHPPREPFRGTVCHDCEEFEKCMWEKGRCYRDAYYCYGSIYGPPPMCPKNGRPGLQLS